MVGQTMNESIDDTLKERGGKYGPYPNQAKIAQLLKQIMRDSPSWEDLEAFQREALDMIANKMGRILNGDPNYVDSWHDIIGYTRLVENELLRREQEEHSRSLKDKEAPQLTPTMGAARPPDMPR